MYSSAHFFQRFLRGQKSSACFAISNRILDFLIAVGLMRYGKSDASIQFQNLTSF